MNDEGYGAQFRTIESEARATAAKRYGKNFAQKASDRLIALVASVRAEEVAVTVPSRSAIVELSTPALPGRPATAAGEGIKNLRGKVEQRRDAFLKRAGIVQEQIDRWRRRQTQRGVAIPQEREEQVLEVCWLIEAIRAPLNVQALAVVADHPDVERIGLPRSIRADSGNATPARMTMSQYREEQGGSGNGVTIAIIDSEVDRTHPAFENRLTQKKNLTKEAWGNVGPHGTAVAGIAAARSTAFLGVAPDATLYNYKVLDQNDSGGDDFGGALAIQQAWTDGARIANCSWRSDTLSTVEKPSREVRAFNQAWADGLAIVKSAGNAGPLAGSITPPGEAEGAIVVGATDCAGTTVERYSSRGPMNGAVRPHLVAPGGTEGGVGVTSCQPGGGIGDCGAGTSFAAPFVAGFLALLLEKDPNMTPDQLRDAVVQRCVALAGYSENDQGAGLLGLP